MLGVTTEIIHYVLLLRINVNNASQQSREGCKVAFGGTLRQPGGQMDVLCQYFMNRGSTTFIRFSMEPVTTERLTSKGSPW